MKKQKVGLNAFLNLDIPINIKEKYTEFVDQSAKDNDARCVEVLVAFAGVTVEMTFDQLLEKLGVIPHVKSLDQAKK